MGKGAGSKAGGGGGGGGQGKSTGGGLTMAQSADVDAVTMKITSEYNKLWLPDWKSYATNASAS